MIARARLLAVVAIVLVGAIGVISSTQTWLDVTLADGAEASLPVAGASAVPVLAPLSLAVLALGAALSIVGRVMRWIFGVVSVLIAVALVLTVGTVVFSRPVTSVASTVTTVTGISGNDSIAQLVQSVDLTPWPVVSLGLSMVLLVAGVFTLTTANRWRGSGRRYQTDGAAAVSTRPRDAVDSWDDLSRGTDPTDGPR